MYIFIVNPIAGNGRGLKMYKRMMKDKRLAHITYETYYTEYPGHGEALARQLLKKDERNRKKRWVIFGGDGTFHEVANGIDQDGIKLAYICGGSGNDFARGTNTSFKKEKLIQDVFLHEKIEPYVLGRYNGRYFINCVGFGFYAIVAMHTNRSKLKQYLNKFRLGKLIYIIQLFKQLMTYQPIHLDVTVDGEAYTYDRCFLLTVNNHPYFGGGMKINPEAKNNPHTYSCLVINDIPKWKVLVLFSTVFLGKHTKFKEVSILEGKDITISSPSKIVYQADGEPEWTNSSTIDNDRRTIQLLGSHLHD